MLDFAMQHWIVVGFFVWVIACVVLLSFFRRRAPDQDDSDYWDNV